MGDAEIKLDMLLFDYGYQRFTEEMGQHGYCFEGEIVLAAEPFADFTRSVSDGNCQLLLVKSFFLHKRIYTVSHVKLEIGGKDFLGWEGSECFVE